MNDPAEIGTEPGNSRIKHEGFGVLKEAEHDLLEQVVTFGVSQSFQAAERNNDFRITGKKLLPGDFISPGHLFQ